MAEFEEILKKHPSLKDRITRLEKTEKTSKLILKAGRTAGGQILVKSMQSLVEAVNTKLLDDETLDDKERACLFRERACWQWLIWQFESAKQTINKINNFKERYD